MRRASVFARLLAFLVDLLFLGAVHALLVVAVLAGHAIALPLSSLSVLFERVRTFSPVLSLTFLVVVLYYFTYLTADGGQTIGKSMLGINVVTSAGENLGKVRAFIRCVCYVISAMPFFLGFLMAFVFRGYALHDILCGTVVIKR